MGGLLLPIILGLMGNAIFSNKSSGSSSGTTTTQETTTDPTRYESPIIGLMDPMIAQSLAGNMKRYSNFGFPKGGGLDTSLADQIISLLGTEGTNVVNKYKAASTGSATPVKTPEAIRVDKQACVKTCMETTGPGSGAPYEAFKNCMSKCGTPVS